ncbi:MAG: hypothetical protein PUJ50_04540, partial [Bacteroidales bacterium]|nr:hypothetical protein [Bacteroidales bacterium]
MERSVRRVSFAASENKSTLLQEVEKRHEHGVHITKMRCAELDGAARLRLNFCDYPFSSGQTCLSPDETSLGAFPSGKTRISPDEIRF